MKKYDLYLFDFDGTLFETIHALEIVFKVSYKAVGIDFDPSKTVEFSRIQLGDGYKQYQADPNKWEDFVNMINASLDYPEVIEATEPYFDTLKFINYAYKHHIPCGIVTSNNIKHVQEVLKFLNIPLDAFVVYVGNQECHKKKPDPEPIYKALEIAKNKGLKTDKVAYVGDGIYDMVSAKRAGVDGYLIDRGSLPEDHQEYPVIKSLMDLFDE